MDFSAIFQMRAKKFWWMDVIFYFAVSLLVATIFCYVVFLVKNGLQRGDIKEEITALQTVGTAQQREEEKIVINYQKKISDFTALLENHEFASNVFAFMRAQTMPSIWFKQFALDEKNNGVQLSGEADSMDAFSRQVAVFEKNKYVVDVATLSSSLENSARITFSISLVLNQDIFNYITAPLLPAEEIILPGQQVARQDQAAGEQAIPEVVATPENPVTEGLASAATEEDLQNQTQAPTKSSEKLITSFHLLLNPEVVGLVNQADYTITLRVPYGTDIKNLTPTIVISPEAVVSPASHTPQNFENPVTYTVVAQDSSVQNYEARVIVESPPETPLETNQSGSLLIVVAIAVAVVVVTIAVLVFVWKKMKTKKQNF